MTPTAPSDRGSRPPRFDPTRPLDEHDLIHVCRLPSRRTRVEDRTVPLDADDLFDVCALGDGQRRGMPVGGYNHNVRRSGRVFHVQTEDLGIVRSKVTSQVFFEGIVIASASADYASLTGGDGCPAKVRRMMQEQHKDLMKALVRGELDGKIAALAPVVRPAERDDAQPDQAVEPPPARAIEGARGRWSVRRSVLVAALAALVVAWLGVPGERPANVPVVDTARGLHHTPVLDPSVDDAPVALLAPIVDAPLAAETSVATDAGARVVATEHVAKARPRSRASTARRRWLAKQRRTRQRHAKRRSRSYVNKARRALAHHRYARARRLARAARRIDRRNRRAKRIERIAGRRLRARRTRSTAGRRS